MDTGFIIIALLIIAVVFSILSYTASRDSKNLAASLSALPGSLSQQVSALSKQLSNSDSTRYALHNVSSKLSAQQLLNTACSVISGDGILIMPNAVDIVNCVAIPGQCARPNVGNVYYCVVFNSISTTITFQPSAGVTWEGDSTLAVGKSIRLEVLIDDTHDAAVTITSL
jgi:hypothetical protein